MTANKLADYNKPDVTISEFVEYDLKHFSTSDNNKGLFPVVLMDLNRHRERFYTVLLKETCINKKLKAAQLKDILSENAAYHHGEVSLQGTIVNGSKFGSNNLELRQRSIF